jgi:hypothetical protein
MELKEYVAESLKQIIDGIVIAQSYAKEKGAKINPPTRRDMSGNLVIDGSLGVPQSPTIIDFDIAVTVSESGEAKAGVGVFVGAVGLGGNSKIADENIKANRIKFSVPVKLPAQEN